MKIFSNTAISLDGKITTVNRDKFTLGSTRDHSIMSQLRNEADAVLVGGATFRTWPWAHVPNMDDIEGEIKNEPKWSVILSHDLDLQFPQDYLENKRINPLVLTDQNNIPNNYPVEVVCCENDKITPEWIVKELNKRNIQSLLIETGGHTIAQFIESGLLTEIFVTICPYLVGGKDAPTMFDGDGLPLDQIKKLQLISSRQDEDELFLHYRIV